MGTTTSEEGPFNRADCTLGADLHSQWQRLKEVARGLWVREGCQPRPETRHVNTVERLLEQRHELLRGQAHVARSAERAEHGGSIGKRLSVLRDLNRHHVGGCYSEHCDSSTGRGSTQAITGQLRWRQGGEGGAGFHLLLDGVIE